MQQLFLYRLFLHSRPAFLLAVIFLICFAMFFYKQMDASFFPYNNMFTANASKNYSASTYAAKVNGIPIKITQRLYWKKDFLEASLANYSRYVQQNNTVYMERYLDHAIQHESTRKFLKERWCPGKKAMDNWLSWYISFAGYEMSPGSTIELLRYDFEFENSKAVLKDSTRIYQTIALP